MNTKNISLLGLGFLAAVAFSSCDKIEDSLSKPITNPQEPIFSSTSVDYKAFPYINASDPEIGDIAVAYCASKELPEGYYFVGTLELSPSEDFSKAITVPLTSQGTRLYANVGDIAAQYTDLFTKNPDIVDLYGRTSLDMTNGSDKVHVGSIDTYFGVQTYAFSPVAPSKIIASSYYIVMGNGTDWDFDNVIKLNHSAVNQYDDPNFSIVIKEGSSVGNKWILMPGPDVWEVKYGEPLESKEYYVPVFDRIDNGVSYGDFEKGGKLSGSLPSIEVPCEVAIDARYMTYSSKAAVECYYATGNGWAGWGAHWMPLFTANYQDYNGFLNLGTEFKFAPQPSWGGDFGAAAALNESVNGDLHNYSGTVKDSGDNIKINQEGLYWAYLNAVTWQLSLNQIKTWGLIGDFNGWGGDIALTPSEDLYTWTGELTVAAGQGWKFRANSDWAINLGGQPDALWTNGDNIVLPEAGTYTITLDLTTYPAKYTAVKK